MHLILVQVVEFCKWTICFYKPTYMQYDNYVLRKRKTFFLQPPGNVTEKVTSFQS